MLLGDITFKIVALILTYNDGELNGLSPGLVIFTFGFGVTTGGSLIGSFVGLTGL